MRSIVWFRRDLRVLDNRSLHEATQAATQGVVGLYVLSPAQWKKHADADCKVKFWLENLKSLADELDKLKIPLRIITCDHFDKVPNRIVELANELECSALYLNREYEVNEIARDQKVEAACSKAEIDFHAFHDRCIVPPGEIKTQEGKFYAVFTPFRKNWESKALEYIDSIPKPKKQPDAGIESAEIPSDLANFQLDKIDTDPWKPGEKAAAKRLSDFAKSINEYDNARDLPAKPGTSQLSPYLAAGVLSARECLATAVASNGGKIGGETGAATWISELAWRDFYMHVLEACPRVSKHQPFKSKTQGVPWREDEKEFEAWKTGQTGYPIVDAGMRQLNQTGWMHNRLRMVTAMFLSKNLLIDWRWGERYFMEKLIDGDLSANNGGWQWSASTGTDSVPYFRIFNPFSQSKRFDSEGKFIKEMCPELVDIPSSALHDPKKLTTAIDKHQADYPKFIVDYGHSRQRALDAFKSLD